jgi:hypothetical protein
MKLNDWDAIALTVAIGSLLCVALVICLEPRSIAIFEAPKETAALAQYEARRLWTIGISCAAVLLLGVAGILSIRSKD